MSTACTAVLCLALLVGCTGSSGTGPGPSDVFGSWKLIDLQGFNGKAHTTPDAAFTLSFSPTDIGVGRPGCLSTNLNVGVGILHIGKNWRGRLLTGCPQLGEQQGRFLFKEVLSGTTRWEIHDGQLTLNHDNAAAVFQHAGAN
jgi:hypothetical protein